jgi:hypothetical protein
VQLSRKVRLAGAARAYDDDSRVITQHVVRLAFNMDGRLRFARPDLRIDRFKQRSNKSISQGIIVF